MVLFSQHHACWSLQLCHQKEWSTFTNCQKTKQASTLLQIKSQTFHLFRLFHFTLHNNSNNAIYFLKNNILHKCVGVFFPSQSISLQFHLLFNLMFWNEFQRLSCCFVVFLNHNRVRVHVIIIKLARPPEVIASPVPNENNNVNTCLVAMARATIEMMLFLLKCCICCLFF